MVLLLVGHGVGVGGRRRVRSRLLVAEGLLGTGTNGLVGVRSLLSGQTIATHALVLVVVGRTAGAAADAEDPEDGSGERESNSEPGSGENVLAHGQLNAVSLEGRAQATLENRENNSRGDGRGGGEDEAGDCEESGDTATPAAADGEDTNEDLEDSDGEGDHVGNEHPLGDGLVDLHDLVVVVGQQIRDVGARQAPDGDRVEVELRLGAGAVGGVVLLAVDLTVAVTHETDIVVLLDQAVLLVAGKLVNQLLDVTGADAGDVELIKDILDFAGCF